jgi:hypothetical protein
MERRRRQRLAMQWGGLALVAQLWVALAFVRRFLFDWEVTRPQLVSFTQSMARFSQLKTPALKYPVVAVYFVLFVAAMLVLIGWLGTSGLREAMAPEPETPDSDEDEDEGEDD